MLLVPLLTGALMAASGATVALSPVEAIGFAAADAAGVTSRISEAVTETGVVTEVGPAVDDACAAVPTCVWERVALTNSGHLLRVTVFRVGSDVEATDTLFARSGAVVATQTRGMPVDAFVAAPLSPDVRRALEALVVGEPVVEVRPKGREASHLPLALPPPPSKGVFVAGAGGLVAVAGLAWFAVEAATLEDATSRGSDKERARVTGWLALGVATVGIAALGGGIAWAVVDPSPAFPMPTKQTPAADEDTAGTVADPGHDSAVVVDPPSPGLDSMPPEAPPVPSAPAPAPTAPEPSSDDPR